MKEIIIEGVKYKLDVQTALKQGSLKEIRQYSVGQKWYQPFGQETYLLANIGSFSEPKVILTSINTGSRWSEPVRVANPRNLTEKEWQEVTSGDEDFVLQKD